MRTREKSTAVLTKELTIMKHRYANLKKLHHEVLDTMNQLVDVGKEREAQLDGLMRDSAHTVQHNKDLQQELKTTKENAQARERHLGDELQKAEKRWYKSSDRVRELEKLLVYNGKAIGALSDLAGDKFKHDDLPF
jgi:ABC-type transporter Mla subunit MlaD